MAARFWAGLLSRPDRVCAGLHVSASSRSALAALAEIEAHVGRVTVPLSDADALHSLRSHIDMVRHRLKAG